MTRQTAKIATTIVALTAIAALIQGCADRRYGHSAPQRATVASQQTAVAVAPARTRVVTTTTTSRTTVAVPPPPKTAVVQRSAVVTTVPAPPKPSTSVIRKQAQTSPTVTERVLAPTSTATATQVQNEESSTTVIVRRDSRGRRIVAASNTSTPAGTLGGRPVFVVDDVPSDVAQKLEEYRLGPGDRLQIKVFGQDEISGEFEVSAAGELSFPLIGQITAENLTPGDFNRILSEALKEFFVNPQVTVEVTNYRPFFILGQVGNPGSYKYQPGLNARMAIAVGGGYTRRASEEPITIFRSDSAGNLIKFDADQDSVILPGDTIEVHRRLF
jgi:protein involved in polysaccharide export with SLBB domain